MIKSGENKLEFSIKGYEFISETYVTKSESRWYKNPNKSIILSWLQESTNKNIKIELDRNLAYYYEGDNINKIVDNIYNSIIPQGKTPSKEEDILNVKKHRGQRSLIQEKNNNGSIKYSYYWDVKKFKQNGPNYDNRKNVNEIKKNIKQQLDSNLRKIQEEIKERFTKIEGDRNWSKAVEEEEKNIDNLCKEIENNKIGFAAVLDTLHNTSRNSNIASDRIEDIYTEQVELNKILKADQELTNELIEFNKKRKDMTEKPDVRDAINEENYKNQLLRVKDVMLTSTKMILMHLITGQNYKKSMVENTLNLVSQLYQGSDIRVDGSQSEMIERLKKRIDKKEEENKKIEEEENKKIEEENKEEENKNKGFFL